MARRRSSLARDLIEVSALLPWWVGLILAIVTYFLLHMLASTAQTSRADTAGLFIRVLATIGQYVVPFLLFVGALVSLTRRPQPYKVKNGDAASDDKWKEPAFQGTESAEDIYELWKSTNRETPAARPDKWSLNLLRSIDWKRFEELCAEYFRICGFHATNQSRGPDGGIDIKLYGPNKLDKVVNVVQCKQWSRMVGPKALRELLGVMTAHAVSRGVFVTSSSFNDEATQFARENGIHLIDGTTFLRKILDRSPEEQARLLQVATEGDYLVPSCPSCGIKLVKRENSRDRTPFWGCKNYPGCRYTLRA